MSNYIYHCDGCDNEIPELQVDKFADGLCHTVGEKIPYPCGPVRKILVIESFPMNFPKGLADD